MRSNRPSRLAGSAGFTLVEVLVVVLIVGIMAVTLVVFIPQNLVRLRFESFADQAVSLLQTTRMRAIRDNREYTVEWTDTDGDAVLDAIAGVTGLGAETSQAVNLSLSERFLTVYADPSCLALTTDGKDHVAPPLVYDGNGTASDVVAFCFQDPNGNVLQVAVDSPSGSPKVRKYLPAVGKFSPEVWQWEW